MVFISFFFLIEYTACAKSLEIQKSLVLDLKILMYCNADEIEKFKKIKEDSDREAATVLQQLKTLSESRDSMQRELVELKEVRDAALEVAEAMDIPVRDGDEPLMLAAHWKIPSLSSFITKASSVNPCAVILKVPAPGLKSTVA